jgi:voltage-gated potassium channel Kch
MEIEKGNLGYAKIQIGQMASFNNIGHKKGDDRNRMLFRLPILPKSEDNSNIIINPMASILPLYAELYDQGLTIEETQPKEASLSINAENIPEKGFRFSVPVAGLIRIYIIIALLILLVFSAAMLRLDVRLGLSDTSCRDRVCQQMEELAKLPFSSALIVECLLALVVIPLFFMDAGNTITWAILLIYLVLVVATVLRLAGTRRKSPEAKAWSSARRQAIVLLLAAAIFIIIFQLLTAWPELGPNISRMLLIGAAATLCLLYIFFIHQNKRAYKASIWRIFVGSLETMPISSVIILDALICLAVTPFLLLGNEAMANYAAILAYLLLVLGVAVRFLEMKGMLNIDLQKEVLIKFLCLAVLPSAGMMGAFKLMPVNPGAGKILLALMVAAIAILLAFLYYYQTTRMTVNGKRDYLIKEES